MTAKDVLDGGFRKVSQNGYCFISAVFFNPKTGEEFSTCVRDYDYSDCSRDNDELYYMPIDEEAKRKWLHGKGFILKGDTVEVVKGKKVPIGTVGKVLDVYEVNDRYRRVVAWYVHIDGGHRTNVENCKVVVAV